MPRLRLPVTLLVGAAILFVCVAVDRWWPCAPLALGSDACFLRQDDSYTGAGTVFGTFETPMLAVGYVLVSVALVLAGRGGRRRLALAAAALPALQAFLVVQPMPGGELVLPLALLTFAAGPVAASSLPDVVGRPARVAYGVGVAATALLLDHMVLAPMLSLGYFSHDTNPWTWLPTGLGCLTAAIALRVADRAPARPGARAAAPVGAA